jgi:hypothetical protein
VAKLGKRAFLAQEAVREATAGNMWPLIGRVLSVPDEYLSCDERTFLRALLESNDGRRGKAKIRRLEKVLVALRVEGLIKGEDGETPMKPEAAVRQVMRERDVSRSFVFAAIKESKKPK